ncbi:MAG: (2Fe-2S)-binding protein [Betaproteobacteria bacterium]|nr:(2Fe-2S)-binding protein [Betaproteobacteria bacterium]
MQRRSFLRACAGYAALGAAPSHSAQGEVQPRAYSRTRLTDERAQPLRAETLVAGRNYIFHYPFEGTPCFLIKLGRPTGRNVRLRTENGNGYEWPGGVGPQRGIVAYSAICTHRMTYPTRQISFISYRERSTAGAAAKLNTIHCCSEHSEYDPASGARVLSGPAPQPLAAILLEYEPATDGLYAVGTLGGDMYNAFFAKYEMKLELDYGSGRARRRVDGVSVVAELGNFCKQQVRC